MPPTGKCRRGRMPPPSPRCPVATVRMVQPTIMISSRYGSHIILVSGDIKFIPKFEGDHPERGR